MPTREELWAQYQAMQQAQSAPAQGPVQQQSAQPDLFSTEAAKRAGLTMAIAPALGPLAPLAMAYGGYKTATASDAGEAATLAVQGAREAAPAAGLGAAQGATAGFADEIQGALEAAGRKIGNAVYGLPKKKYGDLYRERRDAARSAYDKAEQEHPAAYMGGQLAGAVASTALVPGSAGASVGRLAVQGAAQGAMAGLGESNADLTKGDYAGAAKDTAFGAAGGLAGAGLAALPRIPGALRNRLDQSKMIGALSGFVDDIVNKGGTPKAKEAAAKALFAKATTEAGDTPLAVDNLMTVAETLRAKLPDLPEGAAKEAQRVIALADDLLSRNTAEGGVSMTLEQLQSKLQNWGDRVQDLAGDKSTRRIAKAVKDALDEDLLAATKDTSLGKAAQILTDARAAFAEAKNSEKLAKVVLGAENRRSVDQFVSPGKLADAMSGPNRDKVERLIANDPDRLAALRAAVDAAKVLATKGKGWVPKQLTDLSPEAADRLRTLMKSSDVLRVFGDGAARDAYLRLLNPPRGMSEQMALDLVSTISSRLGASTAAGVAGEARPAYQPPPEIRPQDPRLAARGDR